tara:strand:+ start:499 stop:1638 length:1140 start_codon:yes stop_codon:yes gene_type:complete
MYDGALFPTPVSSSQEPPWNQSGLSPTLGGRLSDFWGQKIRFPGRFPDNAPGIYNGPVSMAGGYPSINQGTPWPSFQLTIPTPSGGSGNPVPVGMDPVETLEEGGLIGGSSDQRGVISVATSGGAGQAILKTAAGEGEEAVVKTIQSTDTSRLTVASSSDNNTINLTVNDTSVRSVTAKNNTIDVTTTSTEFQVKAQYAQTAQTGNLLKIGNTADDDEEKDVRLYFGVASITGYRSVEKNRFAYLFQRRAGDIPATSNTSGDSPGTGDVYAYNLAEVPVLTSTYNTRRASTTQEFFVGGVDISAKATTNYPADFAPRAFDSTEFPHSSGTTTISAYSPMVFLWWDKDKTLADYLPDGADKTVPQCWFQMQIAHDGVCDG